MYINVFGALCYKYPETKEVELIYLNECKNSINNKNIRERLVKLAKLYPIYENAANVAKIEGDLIKIKDIGAYLKNSQVVDVSGLSKGMALNVAAVGVGYHHIKVCNLNLNYKKISNEKRYLYLDKDNYSYENLLNEESLNSLRKDYINTKHVLKAFASIVFISLLGIWLDFFPEYISDKLFNLLSLTISLAGLYLATLRK
ncbi:hypothetical protein RFF30_00410 [Pasteurella multocida]|uniref:hypothetical protein n=1 Tax=Pasteurella multocida TaxID=747 RepID=UPI000F827188|nr:hypothetical protein [Pasteurella multocida]MEB3507135.1 hypothetical protein [Pasteurella multocida]WRJ99030.1 hypothetical protein RFF30_00410 [Pasteurella multocida]